MERAYSGVAAWRAALLASTVALTACSSWLLGADDAAPVSPATDAGNAIDEAGNCPSAQMRCGDRCVSRSDPAYGCGASSCATCPAPTTGGQAVCAAAGCDVLCARGYTKQNADCVKDLVVLPGAIGLKVEQARQTSTDALQLSVTLKNGDGAPPLLLDPAMFQVSTAAGLSYAAERGGAGWRWWVDGSTPAVGAMLDAGASVRWRVAVPSIERGGSVPVSVQFASNEATPRIASASIALEACTSCGNVCTYTDRDTAHCGACGVDVTGGSCAAGQPSCPTGKTLCGSACYDLSSDVGHCGSCTNSCTAPVNGFAPSCRASDCSFDCKTGYTRAGAVCAAWRGVTSPTTASLTGVWGSSATDVWATGANGTLLRWNGSVWSSVASGTTANLYAVWGSSPNDVWVVGSGTVLHKNGAAWGSSSLGANVTLMGLWGSGANDVWAVGFELAGLIPASRLFRWTGTAWSRVDVPDVGLLSGVWGSSSTDVWAVSEQGSIVRWNGTTWSTVASPSTNDLLGIGGSSGANVWAVGAAGTALRWNGSAWVLARSSTSETLNAVWSSAAADVWAVGDTGVIGRLTANSWTFETSNTRQNLYGIWGSSAGDAWAVGGAGTILHYSP